MTDNFIIDKHRIYYDNRFAPQIHELGNSNWITIRLSTLKKIVVRLEKEYNKYKQKEKDDS